MPRLRIAFVVACCAIGLVAAAAAQTVRAGGRSPFDLISKQAETYVSKAKFPQSHPQPYPQPHDNAVASDVVGDVHLLLLAGPASNMMSFQVETLSNPEIRIAKGSRLILNVVNMDDDMVHDLSITTQPPPYSMKVTAGPLTTAMLQPYKGKRYSGATLILKAARPGVAYYVCTVPGHAKAGMYGKIVVR